MNITLIGMAGAGKSVIGRALARKIAAKFIDTDKVIEAETGMKLQEIIDGTGEKDFLRIEEKSILNLDITDKCVISTGGSVVYSRKAMMFLKKRSIIVFLDTPLRTISTRVTNKATRGIIHLRKGLIAIYRERLALYKKYAGVRVRLKKGYDKQHIVKYIVKKIKKTVTV